MPKRAKFRIRKVCIYNADVGSEETPGELSQSNGSHLRYLIYLADSIFSPDRMVT